MELDDADDDQFSNVDDALDDDGSKELMEVAFEAREVLQESRSGSYLSLELRDDQFSDVDEDLDDDDAIKELMEVAFEARDVLQESRSGSYLSLELRDELDDQ
jgi:hypothetical protein